MSMMDFIEEEYEDKIEKLEVENEKLKAENEGLIKWRRRYVAGVAERKWKALGGSW